MNTSRQYCPNALNQYMRGDIGVISSCISFQYTVHSVNFIRSYYVSRYSAISEMRLIVI